MDSVSLWDTLASEGNIDLINKLVRVSNREEGFGTIIVPKKGFSEEDDTHNAVLDWLKNNDVNVVNPRLSIAKLKEALREDKRKRK